MHRRPAAARRSSNDSDGDDAIEEVLDEQQQDSVEAELARTLGQKRGQHTLAVVGFCSAWAGILCLKVLSRPAAPPPPSWSHFLLTSSTLSLLRLLFTVLLFLSHSRHLSVLPLSSGVASRLLSIWVKVAAAVSAGAAVLHWRDRSSALEMQAQEKALVGTEVLTMLVCAAALDYDREVGKELEKLAKKKYSFKGA